MSETKNIKLPLWTKAAYGVGQVAEGVMNGAIELVLFFYYTQVLGLSGSLAGAAVFVALLVDAVTDPLAGTVSDNLKSKWGRRHPFMYASIIPLMLSFVLLFMPPAGLEQWGLFAWLCGFAVLSRIAMTLYYVPHMAQGAELSSDYVERTSLVAWRSVFGALGGLATVYIIFMGFMGSNADEKALQLDASVYPPMAITLCVLIGFFIFISAAGTHKDIWRLQANSDHESGVSLKDLFLQMFDVLKNPNFRLAVGGICLFYIMFGTNRTLGLHMNTYFWQLSGDNIAFIASTAAIGAAFGIPFTPYLTKKFDKKNIVIVGVLIVLALQFLPPVLRLISLFPENGGAGLVPLLAVFGLLTGFVGAPTGVASGSLIADLCDEHEYLTGRRQEGIFFGGIAFSGKAAGGVGILAAGIIVDLISFPAGAEIGDITDAHLTGLGLAVGPGASLFGALAAFFYIRLTLTRKRHAEIQESLLQRREASAQPAE